MVLEGELRGLAALGVVDHLLAPRQTDAVVPARGEVSSMIAAAPHREGPFGAKGFSEGGLVGVAPAIANAIYNATVVRIKDLPITRGKMINGLR